VVRGVELTPEARARLIERSRIGPIVAGERKAETARMERLRWQNVGRGLATIADPDYAAACMLFWGEGAKARNAVKIVNSDPDLLVYFIAFLRRYFAVAEDRFRIRVNLFADDVEHPREIESFWLARLGLPLSALSKSSVNRHSKHSQKKRTNRLPYGTCELKVHDTRIVQTIYGSIQELAGFDRPEWLD
jgi:hypothetical protein